MSCVEQLRQLQADNEALRRLVMSLGDKLLILAVHLGRLSERKEVRS